MKYVIQRPDTGRFQVRADNVHFGGTAVITFTLQLRWEPPPVNPAQVAYEAAMAQYGKDVAALQRKAYAAAVRDRTTLLSKVRPRPAEDLPKEERHSVFAHLLEQLRLFDPGDAHLEAELIRQIFDVDEMLYFASPEFWRPGDPAAPAGPDSLGRNPVPPARWEGVAGDPLPTAYSRTSSHTALSLGGAAGHGDRHGELDPSRTFSTTGNGRRPTTPRCSRAPSTSGSRHERDRRAAGHSGSSPAIAAASRRCGAASAALPCRSSVRPSISRA
ncbi:hypothetical protein [Streptomyces sp. NPDC046371]|uniref:hypothetical protein n=1 Tax=Streptomyces sp. NPDC046371 TaxID=3154916 RepID=UPI0033C83C5F